MNLIFDYFRLLFANWQLLSLAGVGVIMFYRGLVPDYYKELWRMAPWQKKWVLLGIIVIAAFQIREIIQYPFIWIQSSLPMYSLADQLFFYAGNIHIRSIMFYAFMIFWLWRKFNALLPALLSGWFFIGLIELTFIPQHLIWQNGLFLGIQHYFPFILIMIPWLLERKKFEIPRRAWIWFAAGIMIQYAGLIFTPWAAVQLQEGGWGFVINPLAQPNPHPFTYAFDISQHLMKTLFTISGLYLMEKSSIKINHSPLNTGANQTLEADER